MKKVKLYSLSLICLLLVAFTGCKKDYFINSGLHKAKYEGNMLQYLESQPFLFDTLIRVIKLAGVEKYFTDSTMTFFAPADSTINRTYLYINQQLKLSGADTLTSLDNIKAEFWRSTLMMYMFSGARGLEEFQQLDLSNRSAFPGEYVRSMGGRVMNIGVTFGDASGLKYQGYRQLNLAYIPNQSSPQQGWRITRIATSNIQPTNGYVHVLNYPAHYFGFDPDQAALNASYLGFNR